MAESSLVLEEYLSRADDRFLPALRDFHDPKKLVSVVERWKRDHRPWARKQIFDYLDQPMNALGHEPVVKRLFKHAEERGDDELMAAFAVAFDRLVRRVRRKQYHYDWQTRASWEEERLIAPRNALPHVGPPPAGKKHEPTSTIDVRTAANYKVRAKLLFTYHTRYYLRRRAGRYFRRKG